MTECQFVGSGIASLQCPDCRRMIPRIWRTYWGRRAPPYRIIVVA